MMFFMMFFVVFIMILCVGVFVECINEVLDMNVEIFNFENLKISVLLVKFFFEYVIFCYEGVEKLVIEDIIFEVNVGEIVVIIGSIGVGKFILINMILCFYDVESGVVKINGIDVCEMD